jgi:hypothetical protein
MLAGQPFLNGRFESADRDHRLVGGGVDHPAADDVGASRPELLARPDLGVRVVACEHVHVERVQLGDEADVRVDAVSRFLVVDEQNVADGRDVEDRTAHVGDGLEQLRRELLGWERPREDLGLRTVTHRRRPRRAAGLLRG